MKRILITGANGHLGRRLISALPPDDAIEAIVRSERAYQTLISHVEHARPLSVTIADPRDTDAVTEIASRCDQAVHLVGTIKETRNNRYFDAHEGPAQALAKAAARGTLVHIVYISILGASPSSMSRCLRSRAASEDILLSASTPVTVIRVPMVLGEADHASAALAKRAAARRVALLRADCLEQPIFAGDVTRAVVNALHFDAPAHRVLDLAGPESLSRRELVLRAAAVLHREPAIHSLPMAVGLGLAGLLEMLLPDPPVTRDMINVLNHDDDIDPTPATSTLGLTLTPLDETLRRCVMHHPA